VAHGHYSVNLRDGRCPLKDASFHIALSESFLWSSLTVQRPKMGTDLRSLPVAEAKADGHLRVESARAVLRTGAKFRHLARPLVASADCVSMSG